MLYIVHVWNVSQTQKKKSYSHSTGHTNEREKERERVKEMHIVQCTHCAHNNYNICGMWPAINCYAAMGHTHTQNTHSHSLDIEIDAPHQNNFGIVLSHNDNSYAMK